MNTGDIKDSKGATNRYSIIVIGKDLPLIEKYVTTITRAGKGFGMKGPCRAPVKRLAITTRKSPCGEGTNSWHRFELRMYKRTFWVTCSMSDIGEIMTKAPNPPGIRVTVEAEEC